MSLTLSVRYDTKTRVVSPPGPGDMPFVVIDVTIDPAGGNAYPVGGEPLDFGSTAVAPFGFALFREVHAVIATPPQVPFASGVADTDGIIVPAFTRDTVTTGRLRFYQSGGAGLNLAEPAAPIPYTALFVSGGTAAFTLLLMGRPLTDAS
jgi:hypothetical protein